MKRSLLALALLATALSTRAEVSVTRTPDGDIELYFQEGSSGPWEPVRDGISPDDVLNRQGDARSDGFPVTRTNPVTQRPEAAWASAGVDGEVIVSWHDGARWTEPRNLSNHAGADFGPAFSHDQWGNRFLAWSNTRSDRRAVLFAGIDAPGSGQTPAIELTGRQRDGRHPSLGVHSDGDVYVAYEEESNGNSVIPRIAIDRIVPVRGPDGSLQCSGENSVDLSRSQTIPTSLVGAQLVADVRVHTEDGHTWVDWVDAAGSLGWTELLAPGVFAPVDHRDFDPATGERNAREAVRLEVLSHR